MSDEQQIAALREEIRRAGHSFVTIRLGALLLCAGLLALSVELGLGHAGSWQRALPALLLGLGLAVAGVHSIATRRQLSRGVRSLPRAECERLLGSLHHEGGGARIIAGRLRREMDRATEIAPARASDARGDEVSSPETAP